MNVHLINWFSSIGLIFEIFGIIFLFKYGLPTPIKLHAGGKRLEEVEHHPDDKNHNETIKLVSYLGLSLVLLGVILQLIGTNKEAFQ